MKDKADKKWEKRADKIWDKVTKAFEGSDNEMVIEIISNVMAGMIYEKPPEEGIPLTIEIMKVVLEKAYGVEMTATRVGTMQ